MLKWIWNCWFSLEYITGFYLKCTAVYSVSYSEKILCLLKSAAPWFLLSCPRKYKGTTRLRGTHSLAQPSPVCAAGQSHTLFHWTLDHVTFNHKHKVIYTIQKAPDISCFTIVSDNHFTCRIYTRRKLDYNCQQYFCCCISFRWAGSVHMHENA